jgi:hypothetical protein
MYARCANQQRTPVPAGAIVSVRHPHGDDLIPVPSIDSEIAVKREYLGPAVDFREPNQTRVGQRHRALPIALHQRP